MNGVIVSVEGVDGGWVVEDQSPHSRPYKKIYTDPVFLMRDVAARLEILQQVAIGSPSSASGEVPK